MTYSTGYGINLFSVLFTAVAREQTAREEIMAEIKFLVDGIACTGCAMDMENILLGMNGVEEASINYREGIFSIVYHPDRIDREIIIKKVKLLGFKTEILAEKG